MFIFRRNISPKTSLIVAMLWTASCINEIAAGNTTRGLVRRVLQEDCGNGNVGNGACVDGSCCSEFGWCGTSAEHCGTADDTPPTAPTTPITDFCTGDGGACGCGAGGDGSRITLNRFWGDDSDEQVWGCGGAFRLEAVTLDQQWGGTLTMEGPQAEVSRSLGLTFGQEDSFDGWEGCCYICGANLQIAGKISSGWYCEKDFFSTGIWLKGTNK